MVINLVNQQNMMHTIKFGKNIVSHGIYRPSFKGADTGLIKDTFLKLSDGNGKTGIKETLGNLIQGVKDFIGKKESAEIQTGTEQAVPATKKLASSKAATVEQNDKIVNQEVNSQMKRLSEYRENPNREIYTLDQDENSAVQTFDQFTDKVTSKSCKRTYKHISSIELFPQDGIYGAHREELYNGLRNRILEAPEKAVKLVRKEYIALRREAIVSKNKLISNLNSKSHQEGKALGIDKTQMKIISIDDNTISFVAKNKNGEMLNGTIEKNGTTKVYKEKDLVYSTNRSRSIGRDFRNIQKNNKALKEYAPELTKKPEETKAYLKYISNYFDNAPQLTSAYVEKNGDICLGVGDISKLELLKGLTYRDCHDVKIILKKTKVGNLTSYRQIYKYKDAEGNNYTRAMSNSKSCVAKENLDKAYHAFMKSQKQDGKLPVYKIPESNCFVFKCDDNYYFVACKEHQDRLPASVNAGATHGHGNTHLDLASIYPVSEKFLLSKNCVMSEIPDVTKFASSNVA